MKVRVNVGEKVSGSESRAGAGVRVGVRVGGRVKKEGEWVGG